MLTEIRTEEYSIASGAPGTAILSMTLTQAVNTGESLRPGSVCAAVAELELMTKGDCPIVTGQRFSLYKGGICLGQFTAEKPVKKSPYRVSVTAYDPVARLDRDISADLAALTDWPYTLGELAAWTCESCGVSWGGAFPNSGFPVARFTAQGITGRHLLGYIAQAAGRFCRADKDGNIVFDWYRPMERLRISDTFRYGLETVFSDGELTVSGITAEKNGDALRLDAPYHDYEEGTLILSGVDTLGVFSGKLQLQEGVIPPYDRVQLQQEETDVGLIYPDVPGSTYHVTGNPLLTAGDPQTLQPIAENLYETLRNVTYTPMTLTMPIDLRLEPGHIVTVTDRLGQQAVGYLMERQLRGHTMVLKCVGKLTQPREEQNLRIQTLSGKVMRLQADVEGLRAENADAKGNMASLSLSVAGIEGQVAALEGIQETVSTLRQDARALELELRRVEQVGASKVVTTTGYSFSDEGLRICKSGMEMENLLDHTGMTVSRSGQTILQADHRGVTAVDVTVGNFLAVAHARFEPYETGTACFYI